MSDVPTDTPVYLPGDAPAADVSDGAFVDTPYPNKISKKELLAQTGISYGQLYRWKREGLIPEEWFEKRSAFTGQETFLPRELVLARVRAIQSLKDELSLSEIREQLAQGAGQLSLRSMLLASTGLDEIFVDSLGVDLTAVNLPEASVKALIALAAALISNGASESTKKEVLVAAIRALEAPASDAGGTDTPQRKDASS
ncbi:MAG: YhbD family protein [Coriobacteriales bacterium]|jgi:DNA-binding transcriptional MerR regulator|nr:YhbD family protein [Coriobacteriales bacterium]